MQVEYAVQPRLSRRLNWRLVIFLACIAAPFLWFFGSFVNQIVTGGVEKRGDYAVVDLKAMGNFPFDEYNGQLTDIPQRFRELDGKKIVLKGFMFPTISAADKVRECQFVYNIQKCCFSGPPRVQERVFLFASTPKPMPMYDYGTLTRVTGTLHLKLTKAPDGKIIRLYDLDVESVKPV